MQCCACVCHKGGASPTSHDLPTLDDPVGTVTACTKCRYKHYPPTGWQPPVSSADGYDPTGDTD